MIGDGGFLVADTLSRADRTPGKVPRLAELSDEGCGVRFEVAYYLFVTGLAHQRSRLALHTGCVVLQECNQVRPLMDIWKVQVTGLRLPRCRLGLLQSVQQHIDGDEIPVNESVGFASQALFSPSEGFFVIA